jgi:hypothetical protein
MTDASDKHRIAVAVAEIWSAVSELSGPRDAAKALAGAHVLLLEAEGVRTEADVRQRLEDSKNGIIDAWRDRAGLDITH